MFIVKKLKDALLALLANSLESAEEAEDAMDNVDMDALTQALCHSARTVYSYEVESNGAFGFRYRGDELFGQIDREGSSKGNSCFLPSRLPSNCNVF